VRFPLLTAAASRPAVVAAEANASTLSIDSKRRIRSHPTVAQPGIEMILDLICLSVGFFMRKIEMILFDFFSTIHARYGNCKKESLLFVIFYGC
jgi:hypothetical protein